MLGPVPSPAALFEVAGQPPEGWAERLCALPDEERARLLARADAAWDGAAEDRARAAGVYRALEADIDPATGEGCRRLRRLFDEGGVMRLTRLMQDAEARAVDPEVRLTASLVLGQWDLVHGDLARCEQRYLEALRHARGRFPAVTSAAYNNYARLCLEHRRDLEALVLARRGAEACAAQGDTLGAAYGRLVEAYVLRDLEDWPRLEALLARLEADLPRVAGGMRRTLTFGVHGVRADLLMGQGRLQEGLAASELCDRLGREQGEPSWSPLDLATARAQVHRSQGRLPEALAAAEEGLRAASEPGAAAAFLASLRLRVLVAQRGVGAAPEVQTWLAGLRTGSASDLGPGVVLRVGTEGGEALAQVPGLEREAEAALGLAAAGALARLAQLEHFATHLPEVARPTPEEAAILAEHRQRIESRERALRRAVARLLRSEHEAGRRPLASLAPEGGLIGCCAWCGRLRNQAGLWLSPPEMLPSLPGEAVALTHGICPACVASQFPGLPR